MATKGKKDKEVKEVKPPVEEKKSGKKADKPAKQEEVKEKVENTNAEQEKTVEVALPETFTTPKGNVYTRFDSADYKEFKELVRNSKHGAVRVLFMEIGHEKLTEAIVVFVNKYWHCIDMTPGELFESQFRFFKEDFEKRLLFDEVAREQNTAFAIYVVTHPEKKEEPKDEKPVEDKQKETKPAVKKAAKKDAVEDKPAAKPAKEEQEKPADKKAVAAKPKTKKKVAKKK
jgi:hypothetical protein